jgi:hypothetical protein
MKVFRDRDSVLLGLLVLVCLAAVTSAQGAPITSSQTITLEHGPDGLWLAQAIAFEWQAYPEWRTAVIYDTWWRSPDGTDWSLPYRQIDVSLTWESQVAKKPLAITAGRRWHFGQDSQGPAWVYGTVSIGW